MTNEIWRKVHDFNFDDPASEYGFLLRLAKENFWTENFTERAVLEYKKFMFLAATSDAMVSPSGIIDAVWHQHLVFSQSYQEFCKLLGKNILHVPSTQSRGEQQRFRQARERTRHLYLEYFGTLPVDIWDFENMQAILQLPKAKFKLQSFLVVAILISFLAIVPLFWLLKPLYSHIGNPYFLYGYFPLFCISCVLLELYNRRYVAGLLKSVKKDEDSFISRLSPLELVYLDTGKLSDVVNGVINQQIQEGKLRIFNKNSLLKISTEAGRKWDNCIQEVLPDGEPVHYRDVLKRLKNKPVFCNIVNC